MKIVKINLYSEKVSRFLFVLRNKNYVRENSFNKKIIRYQNHKCWLKKYLKKNTINILIYNNQMVGYVRLQKSKTYIDCSWAILKKFQGKGFAVKGLKDSTKKRYTYRASIKVNNITSKIVAEKANFRSKLIRNNIQYYYKNKL